MQFSGKKFRGDIYPSLATGATSYSNPTRGLCMEALPGASARNVLALSGIDF